MTTPAAQTLTQAGIAFETVRFDPARDAETTAAAMGRMTGMQPAAVRSHFNVMFMLAAVTRWWKRFRFKPSCFA